MKFSDAIIQEDMKALRDAELPYEMLRGKHVLITGASGMLAAYLVYFFEYLNRTENYGIRLTALVRNEEKAWGKFGEFREEPGFELLVQDVCAPIAREWDDLDFIIHAAGNASPQFILNDPVGIINANTVGTTNVMELAKHYHSRVLYTSTREVYGKMDEKVTSIREDSFGSLDPMERRSCYPESKRMAESILQGYHYQYGVESVIARIAHSYGPGMVIDNDGRVMSDFISDVVHGRDIILKSTGDAVRAFCYITDAVSALLTLLLKGTPGEAYNVANETEPAAIRDAAQQLVSLFPEKGLKVVFDIPEEMSQGYSKMGRVALDTAKLEALGWKPEVSLRDGMKRTVESFAE